MLSEVAMMGALIASLAVVGAGVRVAVRRRVGERTPPGGEPAVPAIGPSLGVGPADADGYGLFSALGLDDESRSALAACVFANAPADHICWTTMVVDPALHDTPSHTRLVGHYETELAAMEAAAELADALNECTIPGEAPLTATALGIEPVSPEPLSRTGLPIAYSGTPLAGHGSLTDLDEAAFNHR